MNEFGADSATKVCIPKFLCGGRKESGIIGWGLIARVPIPRGSMVCEYRGRLIRPIMEDLLEARYNILSKDCYLFSIPEYDAVDATYAGSYARFTNHCCQPSLFVKLVSLPSGSQHLVFTAKTDIQAGQEVTIDYRFLPDEGDVIKCMCGAPSCRGTIQFAPKSVERNVWVITRSQYERTRAEWHNSRGRPLRPLPPSRRLHPLPPVALPAPPPPPRVIPHWAPAQPASPPPPTPPPPKRLRLTGGARATPPNPALASLPSQIANPPTGDPIAYLSSLLRTVVERAAGAGQRIDPEMQQLVALLPQLDFSRVNHDAVIRTMQTMAERYGWGSPDPQRRPNSGPQPSMFAPSGIASPSLPSQPQSVASRQLPIDTLGPRAVTQPLQPALSQPPRGAPLVQQLPQTRDQLVVFAGNRGITVAPPGQRPTSRPTPAFSMPLPGSAMGFRPPTGPVVRGNGQQHVTLHVQRPPHVQMVGDKGGGSPQGATSAGQAVGLRQPWGSVSAAQPQASVQQQYKPAVPHPGFQSTAMALPVASPSVQWTPLHSVVKSQPSPGPASSQLPSSFPPAPGQYRPPPPYVMRHQHDQSNPLQYHPSTSAAPQKSQLSTPSRQLPILPRTHPQYHMPQQPPQAISMAPAPWQHVSADPHVRGQSQRYPHETPQQHPYASRAAHPAMTQMMQSQPASLHVGSVPQTQSVAFPRTLEDAPHLLMAPMPPTVGQPPPSTLQPHVPPTQSRIPPRGVSPPRDSYPPHSLPPQWGSLHPQRQSSVVQQRVAPERQQFSSRSSFPVPSSSQFEAYERRRADAGWGGMAQGQGHSGVGGQGYGSMGQYDMGQQRQLGGVADARWQQLQGSERQRQVQQQQQHGMGHLREGGQHVQHNQHGQQPGSGIGGFKPVQGGWRRVGDGV